MIHRAQLGPCRRKTSAYILAAAMAFTSVRAAASTPLNDLGTGLYLNQFQGGQYPNGSNIAPPPHAAAGIERAAAIQPLNTQGQPDPNGKYVFVSIGMSNTTQEFCSQNGSSPCGSWTLMGQAAVSSAVNHSTLSIINGAEGGKSAAFWDAPTDPDYDRIVNEWLDPNGLSEKQVQAAWVKVANPNPTSSLPNANSDAYRLVDQMGDTARALKVRYPNLQQVFFSSRIYAGHASTTLNPEPYAYESGFAVKWLIEAQINQMNGGGIDSLAGDLNYTNGIAPWLAWGPYLWADGLNPRSDGLIWQQRDFQSDGTHPSQFGEQKVGAMLLSFLLNSEFTQEWFPSALAGDYNRNGTVDAGDYIIWREGLGSPYNQNHHMVWRAHFGQFIDSAQGVNATVTEPATAALLMFMTVAGVLAAAQRRAVQGPKVRFLRAWSPRSSARFVDLSSSGYGLSPQCGMTVASSFTIARLEFLMHRWIRPEAPLGNRSTPPQIRASSRVASV